MNSNEKTKKKLQFLIVAEDKYPPFRVDVTVLFASELVGRGHRIDWVLQSGSHSDSKKEVNWNGCKVYVGRSDLGTSRLKRLKNNLLDLFNDFRVFKLAKNNTYDFIQVKDKFVSALIALLAAKIFKCKFAFWLSYPFPEASIYEARTGTARYPLFYYIRGTFFKFLLYRIIARWADHVFVQSAQMKSDVIQEGMPEEKVTAVPMGIAEDNYRSQTTVDFSEILPNSIVYLGTLLKTRKLDFIIRVFANVLVKEPEARLYIVGPEEQDGDLRVLQEEAVRLNVLEKITFTGRLPQSEALAYVSQAAVCVSPFYPTPILNSTSPTKLIEYMAMKRPFVANDHPEQSLLTSESGGGFCVSYDVDAFANAIMVLFSNPSLGNEMGDKGYKYVMENRTYHSIADDVEKTYYNIISRIE